MAIRYFREFNIDCGFSTSPDGNSFDIRRAMAAEAEKNGGLIVKANLVHGTDICVIEEDALGKGAYIEREDCDGLVTALRNVTLSTTHGDCLPIFAYDPQKEVIGVAHAGWRGSAGGIAARLIECMSREFGCAEKNIHAVIGPGIGACCFEVDSDVAEHFSDNMPWTEDYIMRRFDGKYLIDLKAVNCELLELSGVPAGNIFIDKACSCCASNKDRFFSYRRDGCSERMLAYIRLP